jgi:hypothetical protein
MHFGLDAFPDGYPGFWTDCGTLCLVGSLASHTTSIRETHGIKSFAIGFGGTGGTMASELNAIASNGGTSFTTYLEADDGAALAAALESIASTVITCVYELDDPGPMADPTNVNFYIDGEVVPMNPGCTEDSEYGWDWVVEYSEVRFCGETCDDIKSGSFESITAKWGCPTILI